MNEPLNDADSFWFFVTHLQLQTSGTRESDLPFSFLCRVTMEEKVVLAIVLVTVAFFNEGLGQDSIVVQIDGGSIRGVRFSDYAMFLGIPFAAPPIGSLRW